MFAHACSYLRLYLLGLVYCLLCACGGGGGSGGTPTPPATTTGSLVIAISSLPAGSNGAVRVTGPNNFAQDVVQSTTLTLLAPGSYTLAAANVTVGSATWTPSPVTQTIVVTANATANASVVYGNNAIALAAVEVATATSPVFLTAPPGDTRSTARATSLSVSTPISAFVDQPIRSLAGLC